MLSVAKQYSSGRLIGRFMLSLAACYCLAASSWSDSEVESTRSMLDLDSEVQAIKSETLVISLQLPGEEMPPQVEKLRHLLSRDPSAVSNVDYLRAIDSLERAMAVSPMSNDARLLLARLKLAYGLYLEAGYELHAVDLEGVAEEEQNQAWYELARALFGKNYFQAALEALSQIQADAPLTHSGEYQLLHANVLMALGKNSEAVLALSPWRGNEELAAYGYYNLAIAHVRVGEDDGAIEALEDVLKLPVESDEAAGLRDRARLSLGYLLARHGKYRQASRHLTAVSDSGPFANRAAVALGWIAHQRGRPDEALESWAPLKAGSTADMDTLEALILVPAVHREAENLQKASVGYESAMMAYRRELEAVDTLRHRLDSDDTVVHLLDDGPIQMDPQMKALLGPLLASRKLGVMRRDRSDLHALLGALEQQLHALEDVKVASLVTVEPLPEVEINRGRPGERAVPGSGSALRGDTVPQNLRGTRSQPSGSGAGSSSPPVSGLPQIEAPPRRQVKPFPESGSTGRPASRATGLPQSAQWIKQPPDPEIFGVPDSDIIWLPSSGEFFRRPGQAGLEDYAYPDELRRGKSQGDTGSFLPGAEAESSFDKGSRPVGEKLSELALSLDTGELGHGAEGEPFDPLATGAERERQIAALRQRILGLKKRINLVSRQYEDHARALALEQLDRRQLLLEDLQEQASLELAKTYDRRSQQ
jgi:hypothetical protein